MDKPHWIATIVAEAKRYLERFHPQASPLQTIALREAFEAGASWAANQVEPRLTAILTDKDVIKKSVTRVRLTRISEIKNRGRYQDERIERFYVQVVQKVGEQAQAPETTGDVVGLVEVPLDTMVQAMEGIIAEAASLRASASAFPTTQWGRVSEVKLRGW